MPVTRRRNIAPVEYFKQEEINNIYYNLTLSDEKYASNDETFLQELSNTDNTEINNESDTIHDIIADIIKYVQKIFFQKKIW